MISAFVFVASLNCQPGAVRPSAFENPIGRKYRRSYNHVLPYQIPTGDTCSKDFLCAAIFSAIVGSSKGVLGSSRPGMEGISKFFLSSWRAHKGRVHKPGPHAQFSYLISKVFHVAELTVGNAEIISPATIISHEGDFIAHPRQ